MKNSSAYTPKPIDTRDVVLPDSLLELTEQLAAHIHDVWTEKRLDEGWVYGKEKNGAQKTTPLLVPYDDLPESEKEYDRSTALETLKLILKLGYQIV